MKKKVKKENTDVVDGWMGTFADMVTLLMAFFVLLYAMADPDPGKGDAAFEQVKNAMQSQFGKAQESEFQKLTDSLEVIMEEKNISEKVKVELTPQGIEIKMEGSSLFPGCSADILSDMTPIISSISTSITELLDSSKYSGYVIEVKGHTDNLPPDNCPDFNTNWELSAYRATGVVEQLLASGIQKDKVKAIAMADSQPLEGFPNTDANGSSIEENQAKNRRVEIFINKFD